MPATKALACTLMGFDQRHIVQTHAAVAYFLGLFTGLSSSVLNFLSSFLCSKPSIEQGYCLMHDIIRWILSENGTLAHIALVGRTTGVARRRASVEIAILKRTARPLGLLRGYTLRLYQNLRGGAMVRFSGKMSNESFIHCFIVFAVLAVSTPL
ncbi:MAG: hypothetical protein V7642_1752 [Burkholderiales bacterium]